MILVLTVSSSSLFALCVKWGLPVIAQHIGFYTRSPKVYSSQPCSCLWGHSAWQFTASSSGPWYLRSSDRLCLSLSESLVLWVGSISFLRLWSLKFQGLELDFLFLDNSLMCLARLKVWPIIYVSKTVFTWLMTLLIQNLGYPPKKLPLSSKSLLANIHWLRKGQSHLLGFHARIWYHFKFCFPIAMDSLSQGIPLTLI